MSKIVDPLKSIQNKSQLSAYTHFSAAERMSQLHLWLGIPTAFISVGLGEMDPSDWTANGRV
jgi:hypothetical protein